MERKAWPYLAGLIDAEGTLSICKHHQEKKFFSVIKVTNADKRIMKWLVQNFGGTFRFEIKKNSFHPGSKIYHWHCPAETQESLLLGLLPYLVVKKNQARIMIEFRRSVCLSFEEKDRLWVLAKDENKEKTPSHFVIDRGKNPFKYAAGFIDGDGSIFYTSQGRTRIHVGAAEFIIIKWFLAHFGGRFNTRTLSTGSVFYDWAVSGFKNREKFLLAILPYLVLKKEQAKLVLEILRLKKSGTSEEEIRKLGEKVSKLNHGFVAETNMQDTVKEAVKTETEHISDDVSVLSVTKET